MDPALREFGAQWKERAINIGLSCLGGLVRMGGWSKTLRDVSILEMRKSHMDMAVGLGGAGR